MTGFRLWHSRRHWERFAREDPMWAVLTAPGKQGNRWDPAEFFRTGEGDVDADLGVVRGRWPDASLRRALDFGCGVGRLTQALARRCEAVAGVDISDGMLARARTLAPAGLPIEWVHNPRPDLSVFEDGRFDLVYSLIVLQHIPPPHGEGYIAEFLRVLAPGGVAVFQVPAARLTPFRSAGDWGRRLRRAGLAVQRLLVLKAHMEMHPLPRDRVLAILAANGAGDVHVVPADSAGPGYESYRYFVRKQGAVGESRDGR